MYVCICKAVTDGQISQVIQAGCCSRQQIRNCTGAGTVCGKCSQQLKQIIEQTLAQQTLGHVA